jgi:hypothetical protein
VRWTLALVVWLGCYAPNARPGAPCPDGVCPEGLVCSPATTTCERMAISVQDGGADALDSSVADGAADAMPDAPPPTATLIQQATNSIAIGATLSATLAAAPVSGNVLVMVGATPSGSLTTVTGGGATWTRAAESLINTNIEIWFGVTDGSSATVTITRTNNAATMWLAVSEWAGLATSSTLDKGTATDGTSATISAGSITTTNARDLIMFAASAPAPNTFGAPTPGTWTAMTGISTPLITQAVWYRIESTTGTFAPQVTHTGGAWDAALVAQRIAP